ncbi:hypothetical protein M8A51_08120 [Schlegelella sp. S2-27]|uniref:Lipoprotein n=1 Tax=Caldimonas mangrovi TaxID=2944811 RepID=A0ABT0YL92_9BURK|nr:hypothetical protein [Caldimonas mangrovi]MCM5679495.1 hypothetical protein [Caldimonas mangrovi]
MRPARWVVGVAFAALALSGCTERPQTADAARKQADTPAWQGTDNPYVTGGWQRGDEKSWEQQIRARTQGQNEYARVR